MNLWGLYIDEAVVAIMMVLSIPLSAVIGHYYLKVLKLKQESGIKQEDIKFLKEKLAENEGLKERVKNLEEIITDLDKTLPPHNS